MTDKKPPLIPPVGLRSVKPLPIKDDSRPVSSLVSFLLPRVSSAAPVHREINLRQSAEDKRRAISSMSEKKNDEMRDRHEKILWMTRCEDTTRGKEDENEGPSLFSSLAFASFGFFGDHRGGGGELKKRVSLLERVRKTEPRQVSYIESSLKKLRTDGQLREEFFRTQQQAIAERIREAREAGASHRKFVESELEELSPERALSRLQSRCAQRDLHMMAVKESKKRFISARQMHREDLVERARSLGLALHDPCEVHKPPPGLILWWALMLAHKAAAVMHIHFKLSVASAARTSDETQHSAMTQRRSFYTMKPSVGAAFVSQIQAWWKGIFVRRLLQRRRAAAAIVAKYLRKVPKIPFQFRFLMKSLLRRVSLMQAHYRAVRMARMLRRNQGVALVNKKIRVIIASIDEDLSRISKKKKQAEAQHSAAIKARKPLFEAEIRDAAILMTDLSRRKQRLLALTDASKFTEVSRVVYQNESDCREQLRQYGLALYERYMLSVNIQRVYHQRMSEYGDSLRRRSLSNMTVPSIASIRKEAAVIPKPVKPVVCVALEEEDVEEMLRTTLLERADADLEAQTAQQFGKRSVSAADVFHLPPSRGSRKPSRLVSM